MTGFFTATDFYDLTAYQQGQALWTSPVANHLSPDLLPMTNLPNAIVIPDQHWHIPAWLQGLKKVLPAEKTGFKWLHAAVKALETDAICHYYRQHIHAVPDLQTPVTDWVDHVQGCLFIANQAAHGRTTAVRQQALTDLQQAATPDNPLATCLYMRIMPARENVLHYAGQMCDQLRIMGSNTPFLYTGIHIWALDTLCRLSCDSRQDPETRTQIYGYMTHLPDHADDVIGSIAHLNMARIAANKQDYSLMRIHLQKSLLWRHADYPRFSRLRFHRHLLPQSPEAAMQSGGTIQADDIHHVIQSAWTHLEKYVSPSLVPDHLQTRCLYVAHQLGLGMCQAATAPDSQVPSQIKAELSLHVLRHLHGSAFWRYSLYLLDKGPKKPTTEYLFTPSPDMPQSLPDWFKWQLYSHRRHTR